jgi:hypothetical protein
VAIQNTALGYDTVSTMLAGLDVAIPGKVYRLLVCPTDGVRIVWARRVRVVG